MPKDEVIIRDPIHGYISFGKNSIFHRVINSTEFQRLRFINSLGVSCYTYPSATQNRFAHSLGVFHLSNLLTDALGIDNEPKREVLLAALLHDLGHSPLSHAMEKKFFDNKSHEVWTNRLMTDKESQVYQILNENFNPNILFSKYIEGPSNPPFLHSMISSQLDVDRFDYLLRDSYFSGNPCGAIDIHRLLRVISILDDTFISVQLKGRESIEHYLISRYLMYMQVYNHRVTKCVEGIISLLFDRARTLFEEGKLHGFLPFENMFGGANYHSFMSLRDPEIWCQIQDWTRASDPVLRDLSSRIYTRALFKEVDNVPVLFDKEDGMDALRSIFEYYDYEIEYYFLQLEATEQTAYKPYDINAGEEGKENAIFFDNGEDVISRCPHLKTLAISQPPRIFVPPRCYEETKRLIDRLN